MAEEIERERGGGLVRAGAAEGEKSAVRVGGGKRLVRGVIYRAPIADVAPVVHGKWISKGDSDMWMCSRCGRCVNNNPEGIDLYCYHCGAKMDEKE